MRRRRDGASPARRGPNGEHRRQPAPPAAFEGGYNAPRMSVLNPTPAERLVDPRGRPYFLWDCDVTLEEFRAMLATGDRAQRAYLVGKLMRQAKPDDVFTFVRLDEIRSLRPDLERYLGRSREFWTWLLDVWGG